jgi:hypothetical protein
MSINLLSGFAREGASVIVLYAGYPNRRVTWTLDGAGSLSPLTDYTDASGRAGAVLTPDTAGDLLTITVDSSA